MQVRVLGSILDAEPAAWDAVASGFAKHGWLAALEQGGVTVPDRGWSPSHVAAFEDDGTLVAAAPLWVRDDAFGEFVWDGPIRSACRRTRRPYAPRAVATVPWIPARGRKLLTHPEREREPLVEALAGALVELARAAGFASLNVHFAEDDEVAALTRAGCCERLTWQYHWQDRGYGDFDGFLDALRARRRNRIRREMKELAAQDVTVAFRPGSADEFATMARLYARTWRRHEGAASTPALTPRFYALLHARCRDDVRLGVATRGDEVVGMTLNAVHGDRMYGRWWGCTEPLRFLHFNVAYHCAVEHCLEQGYVAFEPGHGGDFKRVRGFDPVILRSAHWHADRALHDAIAGWAADEAAWVRRRVAEKKAEGPFRRAVPT